MTSLSRKTLINSTKLGYITINVPNDKRSISVKQVEHLENVLYACF